MLRTSLPRLPLVFSEAGLNELNYPVHEFEQLGGARWSGQILRLIALVEFEIGRAHV